MTRTARFALFAAVVVASIWTSSTARAQDPAKSPSTVSKADVSASRADSVTAADVEKAAQQLVLAVHEAVRKATEDPAVKVAALKVAKNAVTAAQVVITQQAATLETVLDALAKEIAQATEKQQNRPKSH